MLCSPLSFWIFFSTSTHLLTWPPSIRAQIAATVVCLNTRLLPELPHLQCRGTTETPIWSVCPTVQFYGVLYHKWWSQIWRRMIRGAQTCIDHRWLVDIFVVPYSARFVECFKAKSLPKTWLGLNRPTISCCVCHFQVKLHMQCKRKEETTISCNYMKVVPNWNATKYTMI